MTTQEFLHRRLTAQQIYSHQHSMIREMVEHMGAMQAQDLGMVKWAIGLRVPNTSESDIDQAIASGEIIRTHLLRPTWHFVSKNDVEWMIDLTAPHLLSQLKRRHNELELTPKVLNKSFDIIIRNLEKEGECTRETLINYLNEEGIRTNENRASHIFMSAELEKIICSGSAIGNKTAFALFSSKAIPSPALTRNEALKKLALRYFISHGPANEKDFAWWSGLKIADVRKAIQEARPELAHEKIGETSYFFHPREVASPTQSNKVHLIPAYDEYLISYADRTEALIKKYSNKVIYINGLFRPIIVRQGKVIGIWKRQLGKNKVTVSFEPFTKTSASLEKSLIRSAENYAGFMGKHAEINFG